MADPANKTFEDFERSTQGGNQSECPLGYGAPQPAKSECPLGFQSECPSEAGKPNQVCYIFYVFIQGVVVRRPET